MGTALEKGEGGKLDTEVGGGGRWIKTRRGGSQKVFCIHELAHKSL